MLYQKFCTYIFNHENMQFKVDTIFSVAYIFVFKLEKEEIQKISKSCFCEYDT